MKKPIFLKNKAVSRFRSKSHAGFTLIELIVTVAISVIVLGSLTSIVTLTYKSYSDSTSQTDAQNLAVLIVQKIQSETRYCTALTIYSTSQTGIPSGSKQLYYDNANHELSVGGVNYLAGLSKNYVCTLLFSGTGTHLLGLTVAINDKNGKQIYTSTTSIYLNEKPTISGNGGGFIVYTPHT